MPKTYSNGLSVCYKKELDLWIERIGAWRYDWKRIWRIYTCIGSAGKNWVIRKVQGPGSGCSDQIASHRTIPGTDEGGVGGATDAAIHGIASGDFRGDRSWDGGYLFKWDKKTVGNVEKVRSLLNRIAMKILNLTVHWAI